jgi:serine/threonine-protein kinase
LSAEATVRVGTRMGDYQLMELVGEGGTGVVYRGRHAVTDLPVVIKVLHDHGARNRELVEQLVGVARAAGAVHHANLVALIDVGSTPEGTVFVVTEYLEGESLQARLQRVGRLQPFEAINILRQMAHGVGAAHEAGLVHGGLQPSNVFLCKRKGRRRLVRHSGEPAMDLAVEPETSFDQVTLLDLGVAGLVDGAAAAHYRSPEQAEGKPAGPSSDIYSLGAVFYEMVTGTAPADSLGKQVAGVTLASRRVPDAGLDGPIDDIILRCLKKTPRLRFAHTAALCEALDACVTDCAFLRDARPARLVSMTTKPSRAQGRAKPPPIPRPRPLARGRAQPPPIPRAGKTSSVSRKSPKQLIPLPKAARSSAVARGKPPPIPLTSDLLTELPER